MLKINDVNARYIEIRENDSVRSFGIKNGDNITWLIGHESPEQEYVACRYDDANCATVYIMKNEED